MFLASHNSCLGSTNTLCWLSATQPSLNGLRTTMKTGEVPTCWFADTIVCFVYHTNPMVGWLGRSIHGQNIFFYLSTNIWTVISIHQDEPHGMVYKFACHHQFKAIFWPYKMFCPNKLYILHRNVFHAEVAKLQPGACRTHPHDAIYHLFKSQTCIATYRQVLMHWACLNPPCVWPHWKAYRGGALPNLLQ